MPLNEAVFHLQGGYIELKRIGIHQINYFPWAGYFNKMAKSDLFVYLDEVQLTDRGYSQRTPVITSNGKETYLNVSVKKRGHRDKRFSEILINRDTDWQEKQRNFLRGNYAKYPYYQETMKLINTVFESKYETLMDVSLLSINIIRNIFEINTPTIMQSELVYDRNAKKNDLMLALTKSCGGEIYLSGSGAKKYMDLKEFERSGIKVQYLQFEPFEYSQLKYNHFVPGLSVLDMLFNIGIDKSKELFWENLQEFEFCV